MLETSRHSVFVVDDHPLVRESLMTLINQQPDLYICGEAEDEAGAIGSVAKLFPNIVILDISLRASSGLDLIKAIRAEAPETAIIVLSMHDEKLYAERCIHSGARGYVMKAESTRRIIGAIRRVLTGAIWLSDEMWARTAEKKQGRNHSDSPLHELSNRELEVFNLLGRGLQTRQVAETLDVSIKTVHAYCARIKKKLCLQTAAELVRDAIRWHEDQSGS